MECKSSKGASYGSTLFCRVCGMDVRMNPIIKRNRYKARLYCCVRCAKNGRK